ncbi:MAG: S-methyl-5'-thioadenosine phosphorylase [Deltaproteobacteria bacterium]|nr:S-methyl-5'-thioadenosine phosphorylase [Deltaproteobacteria bacterium]
METTVGVIGGSGLYEIDGLEDVREVRVDTPFGAPSDAIIAGSLGPVKMLFLPRHGRGHRFSPSEVNYRANVFALKSLGAEFLISISAVGSMREDIRPGDLVIVDQFFDRTVGRARTFFEEGIVAHVEMADPVCPVLAGILHESSRAAGARVHRGGTYLCIEGPQFSTRGESKIFRSWGVDVIGMTNLPEARLAREAELCFATVALSTDYDCWHATEESVTVQNVLAILEQNVVMAREVIRRSAAAVPGARTCKCPVALDHAILSDRTRIPPRTRERLGCIVDRVLGAKS